MKKTLITRNGEIRQYLVDADKDLHTEFGKVNKEDYTGKTILSNKGKQFYCFDATFIDLFWKLKRGAQIVLPKDIATIIVESGIDKSTIVADAGTGTGALASFLAIHAKKVYTFDNRQEHLEVAKKNFEFLGIKNIVPAHHDVYNNKINVKNAGLITLDLAEPWNAIDNVQHALKKGGFLISYNPQITQAQLMVEKLQCTPEFMVLKVLENIQREWEISGKVVRPKFGRIAHTGFLVVARKVSG